MTSNELAPLHHDLDVYRELDAQIPAEWRSTPDLEASIRLDDAWADDAKNILALQTIYKCLVDLSQPMTPEALKMVAKVRAQFDRATENYDD